MSERNKWGCIWQFKGGKIEGKGGLTKRQADETFNRLHGSESVAFARKTFNGNCVQMWGKAETDKAPF